MATTYDKAFYSQRRAKTLPAARKILQLVTSLTPVSSVADFGCGTGTWLSAAKEAGAQRLYGFEGDWLSPAILDEASIILTRMDLEKRVAVPEPVDLAMSLEVAEHLSEARADTFVDDLCSASAVVLFGAAVPHQGGVGHVNEQWQSYWAQKFLARGYNPYDVVRPHVWGSSDVPYWYQQNTILYIRAEQEPDGMEGLKRIPHQLDMVHPDLFRRIEKKSLSNKIRAWMGPLARKH